MSQGSNTFLISYTLHTILEHVTLMINLTMKDYYNSYSGNLSSINLSDAIWQKPLYFNYMCSNWVHLRFLNSFCFSNKSKWLCAWKVPVHCSVFWPYWSEVVINDFLHHVLHLFYQCTYNSFFFSNRKLRSCCEKLLLLLTI